MKKISLVQGIQVLGLAFISLSVIGATNLGSSNKVSIDSSSSVLSETTTMAMYLTFGEKTLKELPYNQAGFPDTANGGAAAIRIDLNPVAPSGTKVSLVTEENCTLFSDAVGGGLYGQQKTDDINALYVFAVGAVDDTVIEPNQSCKVTATLSSPSKDFDKLSKTITFNISDNENDTEPENTASEIKLTAILTDINGDELTSSKSFEEGEPIYLSGSAAPNSTVNLYIFSDPKQATVKADEDGNWQYTIRDLEPGNHRVEMEYVDIASGELSEREEVLSFSVTEKQTEIAQTQPTNLNLSDVEPPIEPADNSTIGLLIIAGSSFILLMIGLTGLIYWKKKHPHIEEDRQTETINPDDGMGSNY